MAHDHELCPAAAWRCLEAVEGDVARIVVTGPASGIDLGAHCEFRTGAEFDYRFDNLVRLGVGFYHLSNAGIGKQNPGVEMATFVLTVPLR